MTPTPLLSPAQTGAPDPGAQTRDATLRKAAEDVEAVFLAEMLKHAKLGEAPEGFGGGVGEEQFSSFLRQAQAEEMVKAGGIGLAETLFEAMKETSDGAQ